VQGGSRLGYRDCGGGDRGEMDVGPLGVGEGVLG